MSNLIDDNIAREAAEEIARCVETDDPSFDFDYEGARAIIRSAIQRCKFPNQPETLTDALLRNIQ